MIKHVHKKLKENDQQLNLLIATLFIWIYFFAIICITQLKSQFQKEKVDYYREWPLISIYLDNDTIGVI